MVKRRRLFLVRLAFALLLPVFVLFGFGGVSHAATVNSSTPARIWVANHGSGTVSEIDGSTGTVAHTITIATVDSLQPIAVDASGNLWVSNYGSTTVSEINGSTGNNLAP